MCPTKVDCREQPTTCQNTNSPEWPPVWRDLRTATCRRWCSQFDSAADLPPPEGPSSTRGCRGATKVDSEANSLSAAMTPSSGAYTAFSDGTRFPANTVCRSCSSCDTPSILLLLSIVNVVPGVVGCCLKNR